MTNNQFLKLDPSQKVRVFYKNLNKWLSENNTLDSDVKKACLVNLETALLCGDDNCSFHFETEITTKMSSYNLLSKTTATLDHPDTVDFLAQRSKNLRL